MIRIRLDSDNAITTTKRIKYYLLNQVELPDKFIVTGFVNDSNNKELQTTNMSGNKHIKS